MRPPSEPFDRRSLIGGAAASLALSCAGSASASETRGAVSGSAREPRAGHPVMVGSANALPGMQQFYRELQDGADPLDVAIEVVKIAEADPKDQTVGLGGLPNEDGVVQLDAAVMYGPVHKSGAVACIEDILHPSAVARLVMERTDHCLLVGEGAYRFARAHGFEKVDLLTPESRAKWLEWKESQSEKDDWLPAPPGSKKTSRRADESARVAARSPWTRPTGTIHCSVLSARGEVACVTSTSGLAFKIPGRVGDSPIVGAGLYCDQAAGSAGSTGRGEASILSNASFAIVELMRRGATPEQAGLELLARIAQQVQRLAHWQPELLGDDGTPSFGLSFYALDVTGRWAGIAHNEKRFAVADPERGPRLEEFVKG